MIPLNFYSFPPPHPSVVDAMRPFLQEKGTLSSPHEGRTALRLAVKQACQSLYDLIGASQEDQLIFTSSGAEAINQIIFSTYFDVTRETGKNHFIASSLEEAPSILAMERLEKLGCRHSLIPGDKRGYVTADAFIETLSPRTVLLSLSWGNGLTGVVQPLDEIIQICKERKILLHVDASHVLGKGEFPWAACGADFLTFSGEAIGGPKGTGALFIKKGIECSPFILGGNEQGGLRAGGLNEALLIGLGAAAAHLKRKGSSANMELARLKNIFEEEICRSCPSTRVMFGEEIRLPHLTTLLFPNVVNEALAFVLHKKGLFTSFGGGHCQQLQHLLASCGLHTHSALSFRFSDEMTDPLVKEAIKRIVESVHHLQKCSSSLEIPL